MATAAPPTPRIAPRPIPPPVPPPSPPQQPAWTPVPATYIVRFTHYAPQADHAAAAAAVLAASVPRRGWTWRARDNPAAAHPTDFGVMTLTAAAKVREEEERKREETGERF